MPKIVTVLTQIRTWMCHDFHNKVCETYVKIRKDEVFVGINFSSSESFSENLWQADHRAKHSLHLFSLGP